MNIGIKAVLQFLKSCANNVWNWNWNWGRGIGVGPRELVDIYELTFQK
jgi:hypothetical protein